MYISHESRHVTLVDKAMSDCPQIVTRTGEGGWVVVVSLEEWMRVERRNGNLVEFFVNSPLREGVPDRTPAGLPARHRILMDSLLDTNVISELVTPNPDANVAAWARAEDETRFI